MYYPPAVLSLKVFPSKYFAAINSPLAGYASSHGHTDKTPFVLNEIFQEAITTMKIRKDLAYNVKPPHAQRKERKVAPENSSKPPRPASAKKPAPVQKQSSNKKIDKKKPPNAQTAKKKGKKPNNR